MRLRAFISIVVVSVVAACFLYACGDDSSDNACADGSTKVGSRCTEEDSGASTPHAGTGGTKAPPTGGSLSCGEGTVMMNGKCVVADGGSTTPPPAPSPVGSGCKSSDDCADGTTCLIDDKLPGGLCTVAGCDMTHPCPTGAYCNRVTKGFNICMPYCQDDSSCRKDEGYVCQSLYTNAINICAPPCSVSGACTSGTNCNAKTGLCELAECDPNASTSGCKDTQTCWPDTQNLSSKGGLCLVLCDPNKPKDTCKVDEKDEVCQPLAEDPANKGFCAPPVCSKTEECPAGALCQNNVCQPPALCDSNGACDDDSTTCVSGVCMPKCPTGAGDACSDIHPGLTCASVLDVPACLPVGSFPGSECRANRDDACSDLAVEGGSAPMVCENNTCLVDCTDGGQALCQGIDADLLCASGIFDKPLCLPKGAFPGGPCGANDSCAQDLQGNSVVDMKCVSGTCVIDCDESSHWSGYGDALCSVVDPTLTCANAAGSICVRACGSAGACDTGYSCLDAGSIGTHENSCLPTGSFPGSPCATGNTCSALPGGLTQSCVNDTCVVNCGGGATAVADDAICNAVDPSLTCSESAGDICVRKCNGSTCADAGFSCLNPGTEGACLPTGSFPGSPCRSGSDKCDVDLSGNAAVDMKCVENTCVVDCNTAGTTAQDDGLCAAVSPVLTCTESAGNICVLKCNNGACVQPGFSCLANGGENACLPTGSFPSSPCLQGDVCLDLPGGETQDCVPTTDGPRCLVDCDGNDDTTTCQGVSAGLVCSEAAGNHCVIGCVSGECEGAFSCFTNGGENACLPNGTFPGSTCGAGDLCLPFDGGGLGQVNTVCTPTKVCAPSCDVQLDHDGFCQVLDDSLTCLDVDGVPPICVPACENDDDCAGGFSCFPQEGACLPTGSFPGSPCDDNGMCADVPSGSGTVPQECVAGICVPTCPGNVEAKCTDIDPSLTCSEAAGSLCVLKCNAGSCIQPGYSCFDPFGQAECLPNGTFPGSPCGASNFCAQDVKSDPNADMVCTNNTCVVSCAVGGETTCTGVSSSLTCSEAAGNLCVLKCNAGSCIQPGYSCFDPLGQAECLPNGTFPGAPCGPSNFCAQDLKNDPNADMICANNTCVVSCAVGGEATCTGVSSSLTCSESAGNLCVLKCNAGACVQPGYSCFDPTGQAECLPNGTFPGSTCGASNFCAQNVKNDPNADMVCVNNTCVVSCAVGGEGTCTGVSSSLTCSEASSNLCVLKCNAGSCVQPGYSCFDPLGQAECLPNGTFPGSTCGASNFCAQNLNSDPNADMVCTNTKCLVSCAAGGEATCTGVSASLTCSEVSNNLCVLKCSGGSCIQPGYSCFDPSGQTECLPNGTFPGSACSQGTTCFPVPKIGGGTAPQACVSIPDPTCLVACPDGLNATCQAVDPSLICSNTVCIPD